MHCERSRLSRIFILLLLFPLLALSGLIEQGCSSPMLAITPTLSTPSLVIAINTTPSPSATGTATPLPSPTFTSTPLPTLTPVEMHLGDGREIRLMADERVFVLFCALNLAGYDYVSPVWESPVRAEICQHLENLDPSLQQSVVYNVRGRFLNLNLGSVAQYALSVGPPPAFEESPSAQRMGSGLNRTLAKFYTEADLHTLWLQHQEDYATLLDGYQALLPQTIEECDAYLRFKGPHPQQTIVLIPELMLVEGSGFAVQLEGIEGTLYIILGPSAKADYTLLQHEYMESIIGPLFERHKHLLEESGELYDLVRDQPVRSVYSPWSSLVREALIKALSMRLARRHGDEEFAERAIQRWEAQGFLPVRYFYETLAEYEAQESISFEEFLPHLLEGINVEREWEEYQALKR